MEITELVKPFNDRGLIESIKYSKAYRILSDLCDGLKISQDDKDFIYEYIRSSSYFNDAVALLGVKIDFSPFLKRYWVKFDYGTIQEFYAFNKTSIRNCENNIMKIKEV